MFECVFVSRLCRLNEDFGTTFIFCILNIYCSFEDRNSYPKISSGAFSSGTRLSLSVSIVFESINSCFSQVLKFRNDSKPSAGAMSNGYSYSIAISRGPGISGS